MKSVNDPFCDELDYCDKFKVKMAGTVRYFHNWKKTVSLVVFIGFNAGGSEYASFGI